MESTEGFLNPYRPIDIHGHGLPHWQQGSSLVFLTWRLFDSVPAERLRDWTLDRRRWLACHPEPHDAATRASYRALFPERLEAWLDSGEGRCELRLPANRAFVEEALRHQEGETHELHAFAIMPNHVHVLVRLLPGCRLEDRVRRWKTWSARRVNQQTGRTGALWQDGYWDRLVRDADHRRRCLAYIRSNPIRARLQEDAFTLWTRVEHVEAI
jgi:REP element-mobilizing transposase RayT